MTKLIVNILSTFTLLSFISCGQVVDGAIGKIAQNVEAQINGSSSFSKQDFQGIWQISESYEHYNLEQVYEEANNLSIQRFDQIGLESEENMEQSFLTQCTAIEENLIDDITTKYYFIVKEDYYEYVALSSVKLDNGQAQNCWLEISQGEYNILGNYLQLSDGETLFTVNFLDQISAEIGYTIP